jgi:hypothetical protein
MPLADDEGVPAALTEHLRDVAAFEGNVPARVREPGGRLGDAAHSAVVWKFEYTSPRSAIRLFADPVMSAHLERLGHIPLSHGHDGPPQNRG